MEREEWRRADALDDYWDEVLRGEKPSRPAGVDAVAAAVIAHLRESRALTPHTAARERVRRQIGRAAKAWEASVPPAPPPLAGSGAGGTTGPRSATPPAAAGPPGRAAIPFATAALLVATFVASFFAFGPGRPGQEPREPAFLPATGATPATQEVSEGPIAEFLWQSQGGPDLPLLEPGQPAVDPRGNLWVPDGSYGQFLIFAPDGTFLEAWGKPGSGEGEFQFEDPRVAGYHMEGAVAFDAAGNIYVADTGNHRIQKFGPDRSFITSWGSEGSGNGQFRRPISVAVDEGGRVYVSDEGWGKIEVFGPDGEWLATWPGLGSPVGLAIAEPRVDVFAANGAIALWVAEAASVVKFSADGELLTTWNAYGASDGQFLKPISVAVDGEGRVYVADYDADRIQVFASDGTLLGAWGGSGEAAGRFQQPRGIALDGSDYAYVVETGGKRVQKFRLLPPLSPMEIAP